MTHGQARDADAELAPDATVERDGLGWSISLPLRAEVVQVRKRVVVSERVVVRRMTTLDVERVEGTTRRERLRVDPSRRDVQVTERTVPGRTARPARAPLPRRPSGPDDAPLSP